MKVLLLITLHAILSSCLPFGNEKIIVPRNGIIAENRKWQNGEIPYEIDKGYSNEELLKIYKAIEDFHNNTCIRFRPRIYSDKDYIFIGNYNKGCESSVGRRGGRQIVILQSPICFNKTGIITHQLNHVLGFHHEQERNDRDDFVKIMWDNIADKNLRKFIKYDSSIVSNFGETYDYGSIMHWGKYAYSVNSQPTIIPKDKNAVIGQLDALSTKDIAKINKMYENYCKDISAK